MVLQEGIENCLLIDIKRGHPYCYDDKSSINKLFSVSLTIRRYLFSSDHPTYRGGCKGG